MSKNSRLRKARILEGLTQLELAERVGRRELDISRYETGRAHPDADTKQMIAAVLGRPAYILFDQ